MFNFRMSFREWIGRMLRPQPPASKPKVKRDPGLQPRDWVFLWRGEEILIKACRTKSEARAKLKQLLGLRKTLPPGVKGWPVQTEAA